MVDKKVKLIAIALLSLLLFPSLVAAVATKSNQPPTMPSFDPFKAYYPSNRTEILAARNI
jgi:hypothetical protein